MSGPTFTLTLTFSELCVIERALSDMRSVYAKAAYTKVCEAIAGE